MARIGSRGNRWGDFRTPSQDGRNDLLAFALDRMEAKDLAKITNYAEFLERHPPIHRVEIFENTAWSCIHGIERWRSNCGLQLRRAFGLESGVERVPLREAFDWLRDSLAPRFEEKARLLLKDPWAARDAYISVVLDRSSEKHRSASVPPTCGPRFRRSGSSDGAEAAGAAATRHVDVHKLRLVLR